MPTFIKAGFWEKLCKPCNGYKGWLNLDEFIQSFIPPTGAVTSITAGNGISVNQSTGDVIVSNTSSKGFQIPIKEIFAPSYLRYTVALTGASNSTVSGTPNLMSLSPFIPSNNVSAGKFSIYVTTGVASALAKILVYSDLNGAPYELLLASTDLDCSTTGAQVYSLLPTQYIFEAGRTYWIGTIVNSTQTTRAVTASNLLSIGTHANSLNNYTTLNSTNYLYTDPLPEDPSLNYNSGSISMVMMSGI